MEKLQQAALIFDILAIWILHARVQDTRRTENNATISVSADVISMFLCSSSLKVSAFLHGRIQKLSDSHENIWD